MASLWLVVGNVGCSMLLAPLAPVLGPTGFVRDQVAYNDTTESVILGWRNHVWSKRAWYQQRHLFVGHPYVVDFGEGFRAGYIDVAGGADGCVPVLPPRRYWSWRYQSPEGQAKTNAWFEGYPLGAAAAQKDGIANWGEISTGYTADSKSIRGRANYVRIRDELLKRERRQQLQGPAEDIGPPEPTDNLPKAPDSLPGLIPLREPDDLPPPVRPEPKLQLPEPQADPQGLEQQPEADQPQQPQSSMPRLRPGWPDVAAQSVAYWQPATPGHSPAQAKPVLLTPRTAPGPVAGAPRLQKPMTLKQPLPPLVEPPLPPGLRFPSYPFRLDVSDEMLDSLSRT